MSLGKDQRIYIYLKILYNLQRKAQVNSMNSKVCWCGNQNLQEFSSDYSLCSQCGTLVLNQDLTLDEIRVKNDRDEFYSKKYWLSYQTDEYGYPDIRQRSRQDLPRKMSVLVTYSHGLYPTPGQSFGVGLRSRWFGRFDEMGRI